MYTIYKITSPSGKCYVGLTSLKLSDRWDAHCTRAMRNDRKHPFMAAIRKYGKAAFIKEVLATTGDLATAKALEIEWIARYRSNTAGVGYNVSPGGDYDAVTGKQAMQEKMKDPAFSEPYRAKLRAAMRTRDPALFTALAEAGRKWRREHQRQNYEHGHRAIRIATRAQNRPWTGGPGVVPGTFGRLWMASDKVLSARRAYFQAKHAIKQWAGKSTEEKAIVGAKISAAKKAAYAANPEKKAKNFEQLKAARANVDRRKQAAAASTGQKAWWVELRKDPIRYAEHINRRRESLRTNIRHRERGAEEPVHD